MSTVQDVSGEIYAARSPEFRSRQRMMNEKYAKTKEEEQRQLQEQSPAHAVLSSIDSEKSRVIRLHHPSTKRQIGEPLRVHYKSDSILTFELVRYPGKMMRVQAATGKVDFAAVKGEDDSVVFELVAHYSGTLYFLNKAHAQRENRAGGRGWYLCMTAEGKLAGNGSKDDTAAQWLMLSEKELEKSSSTGSFSAASAGAGDSASDSSSSASSAVDAKAAMEADLAGAIASFPGFDAGPQVLMQFFQSKEGSMFLKQPQFSASKKWFLYKGLIANILHRPDWPIVAERFEDFAGQLTENPYYYCPALLPAPVHTQPAPALPPPPATTAAAAAVAVDMDASSTAASSTVDGINPTTCSSNGTSSSNSTSSTDRTREEEKEMFEWFCGSAGGQSSKLVALYQSLKLKLEGEAAVKQTVSAASGLSFELMRGYFETGYCVIPNVIPTALLQSANQVINYWLAKHTGSIDSIHNNDNTNNGSASISRNDGGVRSLAASNGRTTTTSGIDLNHYSHYSPPTVYEAYGSILHDMDILALLYRTPLLNLVQRLLGAGDVAPVTAATNIRIAYPSIQLTPYQLDYFLSPALPADSTATTGAGTGTGTGSGAMGKVSAVPVPVPVASANVVDALPGDQWFIEGFTGNGDHSPYTLLLGVALTDISEENWGNFCVHGGSHMMLLDEYYNQAMRLNTSWSQPAGRFSKPNLGAPSQIKMLAGDAFLCSQRNAFCYSPHWGPSMTSMVFFKISHVDHQVLKESALKSLWVEYPASSRYYLESADEASAEEAYLSEQAASNARLQSIYAQILEEAKAFKSKAKAKAAAGSGGRVAKTAAGASSSSTKSSPLIRSSSGGSGSGSGSKKKSTKTTSSMAAGGATTGSIGRPAVYTSKRNNLLDDLLDKNDKLKGSIWDDEPAAPASSSSTTSSTTSSSSSSSSSATAATGNGAANATACAAAATTTPSDPEVVAVVEEDEGEREEEGAKTVDNNSSGSSSSAVHTVGVGDAVTPSTITAAAATTAATATASNVSSESVEESSSKAAAAVVDEEEEEEEEEAEENEEVTTTTSAAAAVMSASPPVLTGPAPSPRISMNLVSHSSHSVSAELGGGSTAVGTGADADAGAGVGTPTSTGAIMGIGIVDETNSGQAVEKSSGHTEL